MIDLQVSLRDASELVDVATEVYEAARAAGVRAGRARARSRADEGAAPAHQ